MPKRLWVDDEREAPLDWMWAKTNAGAIALLGSGDLIEQLSLDYVLKNETTDEIMYWLRDNPDRWPIGDIQCHSDSSSAQDLIATMVRDFKPGD